MSSHDYSGVLDDGRWLAPVGWRLFGVGMFLVLCALAYVLAIVLVVLTFAWTMDRFGS
jgi:hypothetical protein